ncbi:MAG: hypothetical protein QM820_44935 [Minicystis sp.]
MRVYRGLLHDVMDRPGDARACLDEALRAVSGSGDAEEALALAGLASLDASEGKLEEARARFEAAERGTYHWAHVPAIFWVMRGHLDLAAARAALAGGDARAAAEHARSARRRARLSPGTIEPSNPDEAADTPPVWLGFDVRIAQLGLEHAIARVAEGLRPAPPAEPRGPDPVALVVPRIGNWFRPPGGERVSAPGKLCRVLATLAVHQQRAPGAPLSIDAMIERGWPGEAMHPEAGARRVYTAIWHLRRLGLKDAILRVDGGYLLDPALRVELVGDPRNHDDPG